MCKQKKKKSGKFIKMANFIGSKTENQCRSHHQKMLLTYKSIENIMKYVSLIKKRGELIALEEFEQLEGVELKSADKKVTNAIEE
jgi:hypothetical protein